MRYLPLGIMLVATNLTNPKPAAAQQLTGRDKWADSASVLIEAGSRTGDPAQIDDAKILLDRALTAFPGDALLLHYQGYGLYRKATLAIGRKVPVDTGPMLDSARAAFENSAKKMEMPETFALQSAVLGQIISKSKNPITAMTLGAKSSDAMTRAVALGPKNPRVWLLRGISAMFTPAMWGGGLDKSESYLKQSLEYFESDSPARPMPAWGHAEAYIWLGQVYAKQGKSDAARAAFLSAVKTDPANGWARYLLSSAPAAAANR